MRRILIGLTLALAASPAAAQSPQEIRDNCFGATANIPDEARIGYCTQAIQGGQLSTADLAVAYYDRGLFRAHTKLYDAAIADYTQAIALNPNYASAFNNRAWAYHLKGEDAKGLTDADTGVSIAPTANHYETRAEIYEKLGQRDKAIADYRAALNLDPGMQDAQDGLKRLSAAP